VRPRSRDINLREPAEVARLLDGADTVYHLAAVVGGIAYNIGNPARLIHDNAVMGLHLLAAARQRDVGRLVLVGSAGAYPGDAPVPTEEDALWDGYPEKSNAPYGAAKRLVTEAGIAYARQYGMRVVNVLPTNLFGPHDHFDPTTAHVLPSLMTRFHRAKLAGAAKVVCWGDGTPTRDLLYVEDCARLLHAAPDVLKDAQPVNLGTGEELSIARIAAAVKDVVGFAGTLEWDTSKPNGQRRRALSTRRMRERFGDTPLTPFEEGMRRTYAHFLTTPWAAAEGL
jgi:GDP-L-fucose synthase